MALDVCPRSDLLQPIGCLPINHYCKNLLYKSVFHKSYTSSMFLKFLTNIYYPVYFNNIFDDNKSKIIILEVNLFLIQRDITTWLVYTMAGCNGTVNRTEENERQRHFGIFQTSY